MRSRRLLLAASVLAAVPLLLLASSQAATPGSGSVSSSSPFASWTGDFKTPTAGGCTGPSDATCDNYKLSIQAPSSSFKVTILLDPTGDWDLDVFAPDGSLAGSSGSGPGAEEVVVLSNPPSGIYTVSAAPFTPLPNPVTGTYTASATLTLLGGVTQPPPGTEPITFSNSAAPNGFGIDAGEPSVGSNLKTGNSMFQSSLQTLKVAWNDSTSPAVPTWSDVSFATTSVVSLDPIGVMDQRTNRWFSSELSGTTSLAAFTNDDGASWTPSEGGALNSGVDHQTIGMGPYHAPLVRDPNGLIYPDAVYYCSQDLVAALCARSDNGGLTFAPAVPIYTNQCVGLHGHVKVAPDGTVYVPNKSCGGQEGVAVSEDNGLTWSIRTVPGSTPGAWDPSVGIASDGTVYFGYDDGDGHAKVAVSHDQGRSWTNIRDVGVPFAIVHSAFPAAVAGDPTRAAFAFLGTPETSNGAMGDDPNWPGVWHLYVAETFDGGNTWTTVDATPNDPVQRGTICGGGTLGCGNGTRNLLDFMDTTVDKDGRVLVGYADGCTGPCAAAPPGNFTALGTIARQVNGKRLFAVDDVLAAPSAPLLSGKASNGPPPQNILTWQAPDDHGSAITGYRLYRRTASTSPTLIASPGGGTLQYTDTAITAGTSYYYTVAAVNSAGESAKSNEVLPVAPPAPPPAQDACVEPGVTILTDKSGDELDSQPSHDVQSLSIAEPQSIGLGKIEFILKMADLSTPTPLTYWPVAFKTPDGTARFVRMATDAIGTVTLGYGTGDYRGTATPADPASSYKSDGTIKIIVPRAAFGIGAGDQLNSFLTRVTVNGTGLSLTPDNMPDSLAPGGTYTVKGNENCTVAQPDLAISANDLGFTNLRGSGNDQAMTAIVHNLGNATARNVQVRFIADGSQVGSVQTIQSLAPGAFTHVTVVWNTNGQNGQHSVGATADPANTIAESNETNNTGSRTVTVQGSKVTG